MWGSSTDVALSNEIPLPDAIEVPDHVLELVPVTVARQHFVIPIAKSADALMVAVPARVEIEIMEMLQFILNRRVPADAIVDALHIACAAVNRVDYLLTWNCTHIANPMILPRVFRALDDFALPFPVVCTGRIPILPGGLAPDGVP